jgi:hypothetical protein
MTWANEPDCVKTRRSICEAGYSSMWVTENGPGTTCTALKKRERCDHRRNWLRPVLSSIAVNGRVGHF